MSIPRPAAVPNTSRGALWHLGGLMLICADGAATDGHGPGMLVLCEVTLLVSV
jgi:hypothetical protein